MIGLWKLFRAALPYMVAVAVVLGALFAAYRFGVSVENAQRRAEVADLKRDHGDTLALLNGAHKDALAKALQEVADAKDKAAADMAALDEKFTKEMNDAKSKSEADVAAVRAGAIRVRDRFTCTAPADSAAGPGGGAGQAVGTSAGVGDGAAVRGLGPQDAGEILAVADTGDRWAVQLRACQAIIAKDRQP